MRSRSSPRTLRHKRHTDKLRISSGALGPVSQCELEIRPLTVFIGRQGTGKSLVAQVLYFFEELPFLIAFTEGAQRQAKEWDAPRMARWILDQLRSHQRAFAVFANPTVNIEWERSAPYRWASINTSHKLALKARRINRTITLSKETKSLIENMRGSKAQGRRHGTPPRNALFIPTERMVISQLKTALSQRILSLPLTYTLFADWLESSSTIASEWPRGISDSRVARRIARIGQDALGGRAERRGEQWKWRFSTGKHNSQFDIDMASSGQRANWSLPYVAQTLFDMRDNGDAAESLTIFVEEPEIHLHPSAQVEMVRILALLVREGFRVVLTTHSLNVIYALNNFIQASRLDTSSAQEIPELESPLRPEDVSVYAFTKGKPRQLVNVEAAFIDERELGEISEELAAGLNRIGALRVQQEEES